ncbi:MAG: PorT family protein, partial [Treponema sp.]|nr:PorT family protein [Treponema sp.]
NAAIINLLTRIQDVGRPVEYQDINDGMRAMEELSVALTSTTEQISRRQQEEEERKREEEKQRLKDKRKAEFVDDLRENSGLGLGVRGGMSINFFENLPKSWDGDGVAPMFSALLEIKIGRFFSIQPEFVFVLATEESTLRYSTSGNFTDPDIYSRSREIWKNKTGIHYSLVQIPVLAKANLSTGNFTFSPAVGLGFNIPVGIGGSSDIYSTYNSGHSSITKTTNFDVEVSMPISLIFGMEAGLKLGKNRNWLLFADLRYIKDLGDTKIDIDTSKFYDAYIERSKYAGYAPLAAYNIDLNSYTHSSFDISLGIKFVIPFARQ